MMPFLLSFAVAADWSVGAARVDVTPPETLDTFGHGPNARTTRGHRGRLVCTAIVLDSHESDPLALVACDLHSIGTRLQQRVARLAGLNPAQVVLSATHTHGGPAHYFTEASYSGLFSSDKAAPIESYLELLAAQIARGVADARADAAANPGGAGLAVDRFEPEQAYAWNRSIEPHCAADAQDAACATGNRDPRAAVDMRITLARFYRGDQTLATHVVLPLHPTAIPNTSDVFHADLHGLVREHLERRLSGGGWFAMANGAEGDVSPLVVSQTWTEARRVANAIGDEIAGRWGALTPEPLSRVSSVYGRMALPRGDLGGARNHGEYGDRLCPPELGNAAASGAELGITWLMLFGDRFREGDTKPRALPECQNPKRSAQKGLFQGARAFPTQVPLHRLELNDWVWTTVPGEATTAAGKLLAEAAAAGEDAVPRVTVLGLAGGYVQYIATEEEFLLQHYEGASTLFGRNEALRFFDRIRDLRDRAPELSQCRVGSVLMPATGPCPESVWTAGDVRRRAYPHRFDGGTRPSGEPERKFAWLALNDPEEPSKGDRPGRLARALALRDLPAGRLRVQREDRGCGRSVRHRLRWAGASGAARPGQAVVRLVDIAGVEIASDLTTDVEIRLPKTFELAGVGANAGGVPQAAQWVATWNPAPGRFGQEARWEVRRGDEWAAGPTFTVGAAECVSNAERWQKLPP